MDHSFAIYQLQMQMWDLLYADWKNDIMTFKYWGVFAFIIIYYLIWWKLTDKRRISDLLLFGSFFAVLRAIVDLAGVTSGLWLYKVRILPLPTSIFLYTLTIAPLTFMLAMQYSRSWKQFFVWGAVAAGFIHFIMIPIFTMIGIFQAMNWNRVYGFLVSYFGALFCRAAFHLVKQVQSKLLMVTIVHFKVRLCNPHTSSSIKKITKRSNSHNVILIPQPPPILEYFKVSSAAILMR